MSAKILIANALIEGDVVFLTADGSLTRWVEEAAVATDETSEATLAEQGQAALDGNVIIDPQLIDVTVTDGKPFPVKYREQLRCLGPSTHLHHGKQADKAA